MNTTAKFEKTSAMVEKIMDWAISSQAPDNICKTMYNGEGSTTSLRA